MGLHTEWTQLEEFLYSANTGHTGENHDSQTRKTKQAANVENLGQRVELSPLGHHRYPSFPKNLNLMPALRTSLLKNFDRRDSPSFAFPVLKHKHSFLLFLVFLFLYWYCEQLMSV